MSLLRLVLSIMLVGFSVFAFAGTTNPVPDQTMAAADQTAIATAPASAGKAALVNINTATVAELQKVKGLSKRRAQAIVDYRTKNGNFKSVAELKNVTGPRGVHLFNARSIARLKNRLTA